MRVVAGVAGGLHLVAPPGSSTRPTSDRVREATFNALASMGVVDGATVLDLFAGSGAMGIEALSRGAERATFVDHDPRVCDVIRRNLETTRLGASAAVVTADVLTFLRSAPVVDLAIADPPYAFDRWGEVFGAVLAGVVVAESDREIDPGEGWAVARNRRYGTTVVTICRRIAEIEETST